MHRVANIVLEVVEETDRDIRQVTEDVLAGGIEAEGDGMEFGIVVVVRLPGRQFLLEFPPEIGRDTEIESILERAGIRVIAIGCRKAETSADIERLGVAPEAGQR